MFRGEGLAQLLLMGPLYLLIYFPDYCLTFLEPLPPWPCQWLMQGWVLGICHLGAVRSRRAVCLIWGRWGEGWPSLLRSHLKLLQGSAPWDGAHTGYSVG